MLYDLTKRIEVQDGNARLTFICNRATIREMKAARALRLKAQGHIHSALAATDSETAIEAERKMEECEDQFIAMLQPMVRGLECSRNGGPPKAVDDWEKAIKDTDLLYEHKAPLLDSLFFRRGGIAEPSDSGPQGAGARSGGQDAGATGESGQEDQGLRDDLPGKDVA